MSAGARPVPVPDELSAPYWAAAARHVLAVPACARCGKLALPPGQSCPSCGSTDPDWTYTELSGRGTVRSWTVVRQSFLPGFDGDLPFLLVDVALAEQEELRLIGRLMDGPEAKVQVGVPVTVAFEDVRGDSERTVVPAFALAATQEQASA